MYVPKLDAFSVLFPLAKPSMYDYKYPVYILEWLPSLMYEGWMILV